MPISLPKELKTQKTNSLPDDLKSIAEQLIADKFGIQEEVVPQVDDFFLDPRMGHFGFDPAFGESRSRATIFADEPNVRDRGGRRGDVSNIQVRPAPWSLHSRLAEIEITYPSWDNLLIARREMDMQNIRARNKPKFIMNPEFYHFFMRTEDARMNFRQSFGRRPVEGAHDVAGEIMGCDVIVTSKVRHCIFEVEF